MSRQEAVDEVERAISKLLQALEVDTGQIVDDLRLEDVDVTTMSDDSPRLFRRVVVKLKPISGTQWATN